jgi:hypothetical protein
MILLQSLVRDGLASRVVIGPGGIAKCFSWAYSVFARSLHGSANEAAWTFVLGEPCGLRFRLIAIKFFRGQIFRSARFEGKGHVGWSLAGRRVGKAKRSPTNLRDNGWWDIASLVPPTILRGLRVSEVNSALQHSRSERCGQEYSNRKSSRLFRLPPTLYYPLSSFVHGISQVITGGGPFSTRIFGKRGHFREGENRKSFTCI